MLLGMVEAAVRADATPGAAIALSGGVDSGAVACLAPRSLMVTAWYRVPGHDERSLARLSAARNGGPHVEVEITPDDLCQHVDAVARDLSGPARMAGIGAFGQWMVARAAASLGATSLLGGDGGDELFGGYARHLLAAGEPMPPGYARYTPPDGYPAGDLEAALAWDMDRLPMLVAVARQTAGAHGLDARAPLLSPEVSAFALALPARHRVGKRVLREALRGRVPDAVLDNPRKMGFPVPLLAWSRREPVRSLLMDRTGRLPNPALVADRAIWHDLLAASG